MLTIRTQFSYFFMCYVRYLLKDQLKGPSSIEGYERALKKGCRYVERESFYITFQFILIMFMVKDYSLMKYLLRVSLIN